MVPKLVFIVPYRDRKSEKDEFIKNTTKYLSDRKIFDNEYKFIFSHQCDDREFNRGAMKNLGFLYAKSLYTNDYENITFVFNDVDIYPQHDHNIDYDTVEGVVKHFYGYTFALGGIFSIKGKDFLNIGGEKYLYPEGAVTLIEWADLIDKLLSDKVISIEFERSEKNLNQRKLIVKGLEINE